MEDSISGRPLEPIFDFRCSRARLKLFDGYMHGNVAICSGYRHLDLSRKMQAHQTGCQLVVDTVNRVRYPAPSLMASASMSPDCTPIYAYQGPILESMHYLNGQSPTILE